MKKIITTGIMLMAIGVAIFGSGSATPINIENIKSANEQGIVYFMGNNASFIAPIPINIVFKQISYENTIFSEIFRIQK